LPLSFFRRKKSEENAAPANTAAPASAPELTPGFAGDDRAAPGGDSTTAVNGDSTTEGGAAAGPPKRRRGSRGGRNRKKKPVDGGVVTAEDGENGEAVASTAKPAASSRGRSREGAGREPAKDGAAKDKDRGRGQDARKGQQSRRRQAPRRAPLPKAKRELLISVDTGEKRVAVLEDDRVAEVYLERPERRSIAGDIYLGTVDNVLPGMEAAFVEIGLEKNGFLYVDEIVGPELEGRKGARKIQDLIQRGQTILVQAVKDPMKTKGARLTTEISLPGRFVVYVPQGEGLGVSRRLEDDERNRLKAILKECAPAEGGVIVRTAAEGASADDIERDLDFLQRLWKSIEARAKDAKAPSLVYQEAELPLRVVRDLFTGDFERLLVDHDRTHKRIVGYLKKTSPHMAERVVRYREREPLMDTFGVENEIKSTLSRRVDLPSGGYLVFDYAEAFTVIDVNTGRFVGSRSKKASGGRLEDTITKNNLEAVKEVVRQLRLRDIGGIIVIDFIDMANPKNRQQVEDALRVELERDRTKTYVVEISPLGLVEMTRQNVTDGPREVMTRKCPTCGGDGIVVSEQTAAVDIERRLRSLVTPGARSKAFSVELNAKVAWLLAGPGGGRLRELEETTKRRFYLVGREDVHTDHFVVLDQGTVEKVFPATGVEVGQELEVRLGELGLHDAHSGAGKVETIDVVVGSAAKLVGKKVTARITAVGAGIAWAELLSPVEAVEPPLTAEAEAEKPTRARRPAKRVEAVEPAAPADDVEEVAALEVQDVEELEDEADESSTDASEADGAEDGETEVGDGTEAPKKKRTRRGSRGGRNRRKPPVALDADGVPIEAEPGSESVDAADEGDDDDDGVEAEGIEDAEPAADEPRRGPRIHVPDSDLGSDEGETDGDGPAPARKRTRRGSRGGRNRRKKPAVAVNGDGTGLAEEESSENGARTYDDDDVVSDPIEDDIRETYIGATEAEELLVEHAEDEAAAAEHDVAPSANGAAEVVPVTTVAVETVPADEPEVDPADDDADGWTYTPMSQWDLDDERR